MGCSRGTNSLERRAESVVGEGTGNKTTKLSFMDPMPPEPMWKAVTSM